MVGVGSVIVLAFLWGISSPWSATSQTTSIGNGRVPRGPPGVVPVDIIRRIPEASAGIAVDSNGEIGELPHKPRITQVGLAAT